MLSPHAAPPEPESTAPAAFCPACGQVMPPKPLHFEEYPKMMYKLEPQPAQTEPKVDTKVVRNKDEEDKAAGEGYSDKVPSPAPTKTPPSSHNPGPAKK